MKSAKRIWTSFCTCPGLAGLYAIISTMNLLGHCRAMRLGSTIGTALYAVAPRLRAKILHNLRLAFGPGRQADELQRIARQALVHMAQNWLELFYCAGPGQDRVVASIDIRGREHLDRALSRGRGVIVVSGHIGNYPLMGTALTRAGYSFTIVIRDLAAAAAAAVYRRGRALLGLSSLATTPPRAFYRQARTVLNNNGILCLIADENKRSGGVFVDFFGRPAATAPGPATLALRSGAAVLPVFITRAQDHTHTLSILPELPAPDRQNPEVFVRELTAAFTAAIEAQIRCTPAQWCWTNWRWRTQPEGKSAAAKIRKKKPLRALKKRLRRLWA